MKINNDLLGKDVIDESGDQVGVVKEVEWDEKNNKVISIILKEGGIFAKIGLGDKKMVPYDNIEEIGDKVLIRGRLFPAK
ncbi:MAG: PRC-barrel domain-containing protein [Methanobacterium sp.]|nr:PRC-barrel domain-containing protein [Methanobacterium sp.]